jgi:hypothetical protein
MFDETALEHMTDIEHVRVMTAFYLRKSLCVEIIMEELNRSSLAM